MDLTPKSRYSTRLEKGKTLDIGVTSGSISVKGYLNHQLVVSETVTASKVFGPYPNEIEFRVTSIDAVGTANESLVFNAQLTGVISSAAPSDSDGRPDGTIYFQTA